MSRLPYRCEGCGRVDKDDSDITWRTDASPHRMLCSKCHNGGGTVLDGLKQLEKHMRKQEGN
jgi:hypothetical protein